MAVFLFLGSIGMGIFSHACAEDGTNVSFFAPDEEVCGKHIHEKTLEADECDDCCCDEEESNSDDCCSTSAELVKVNLDFHHKIQLQALIIAAPNLAPIWNHELPVTSEDASQASGTDPPPKGRQELLADIQQWLI